MIRIILALFAAITSTTANRRKKQATCRIALPALVHLPATGFYEYAVAKALSLEKPYDFT
ncbi:MAG: hypothetical protein CVV11_07685 [Gammaproteobacteria bacterium HGW-Gammaproteobacteria-15]|nr:MAG: hypothetical protein CVV11_07685 [Gammaproteobacteria bacterium HGW-Gammaproteobacteria-15]